MDEISQKLIAYIEASQKARQVLTELHGLEIGGLDVQAALGEVLHISQNPPLGVLDQDLTAEKIISLLKDFEFKKYHPEILGEITLDEPLIPKGVPRLLTEKTVKVKGEVWRIHQKDADSFPSNPHAHNYESGIVLHLGNGDMFDRKRKSVGNIGCKKLLRIRSELNNFALPETGCA